MVMGSSKLRLKKGFFDEGWFTAIMYTGSDRPVALTSGKDKEKQARQIQQIPQMLTLLREALQEKRSSCQRCLCDISMCKECPTDEWIRRYKRLVKIV